MSNLSEIRDEVLLEWSLLEHTWEMTSEHWRDEVAERFARERWREWKEQMQAFIIVLGCLEESVSAARRDCSN